mgnify:CR=1 FL=1
MVLMTRNASLRCSRSSFERFSGGRKLSAFSPRRICSAWCRMRRVPMNSKASSRFADPSLLSAGVLLGSWVLGLTRL